MKSKENDEMILQNKKFFSKIREIRKYLIKVSTSFKMISVTTKD